MATPQAFDESTGNPVPRHATIRDIAKAVGVSETTVSLAYQSDSRISKETRGRILEAGRQLRYVPNLSAQNLRMGKSNTIGFLVNDITNPFYATMVRIAETIAQNRGYQVVFADGNWNAGREVNAIENMIRSRVQGVLICPCEKTQKSFMLLEQHRVPSLVVDTAPDTYQGAVVGNNLYAAGELAAKHLLDVRCQKIALLTAGRQMRKFSAFQKIEKGFLETLAANGIKPKSVPVVDAGLSVDQGKYGFETLIKRSPDVDGVFCVNDLAAIGVIEAADNNQIQVGKDLALIGIDDLEVSRTPRISLTTIRQPCERLVDLAVNALIDSVETQEQPELRMFLEPELILRNSTRRMA